MMISKLSKMKMPGKKKAELEFDLSELAPADDSAGDSEGEYTGEAEGEVGKEAAAPLDAGPAADLSDEELMAELKKRGLEKELMGEDSDAEEEDMEAAADEDDLFS